MQILHVFTLLLGCLYPLCCAQQSCNLRNCSRTNVEICATNGEQCRRFSNECSLQSANCNATLATVWNRTDTIQCLNLSVNATGLCSCPALRTCSNRTTTTAAGICVHRDGHACRLFRTECDLVRARCNGEVWRNIDIMQCRGFTFNQSRTCTCPKSILCSRNVTQLCVQTNATNCRLYDNECDLEGDRCQGQRLFDVNNIHCRRFQAGSNGTCICPRLLSCQRNITNICVRNTANRCQLMRNQCELEQQRCGGTVLNATLVVQCRNIRPGETGDCACPSLETCSVNRTNICVRTRMGCRLKTNECELERSRCQGEVVTPISRIQCRGFAPGDGGPCACPRLETCNRNNTNICIRSEQGCMLLRNECELEQARCDGRNFTVVDGIQCVNFTVNELRNCSCPNMGICSASSPNLCTASSATQCKLLLNRCELEKARCQGEVWNRTDTIQCLNLRVNATGLCSCPALRTCSNRTTTTAAGICVHRDGHACRLFRTECDLVRARCNGEVWRNIDIMQCRGFTFNQSRTCTCPKSILCSRNVTQLCVQTNATNCRLYDNECDLEGDRCQGQRLLDVNNIHCRRFQAGSNGTCICPRLLSCQRNITNICVRNTANRCQLMRSQCELEQQRCGGTVLNATLAVQCRNIRPGETGDCACPSLETCSVNRTNICVRTRMGCRLKTNECELERSRCQGEVVTPISQIQCRGFAPGDGGPCACPRLETCNRNNTNICIRSEQGCMLLRNECELEQAGCDGRNFTVVDGIQCVNFTVNELRNCSCPNMGICSASSPNVCTASSATQCKLLGNRCELEKARCQGEPLTIIHPLQCRGLRLNTTSNCFCPRLRNCSSNTTNICVRENINNNTCTLMRNECELEQAICDGRDIRRVDSIHCRNFTANTRSTCFCPNLATCNRNTSSICVINSTQCRLVRNECELEQAKCEGNNLITTHAAQCLNFQINQQSNCSCPNLITCSQNSSRICVKTRAGCKLLTTQCEWEEAKCRGEALRTLDTIHCQGFRNREERSCFCSNLKTCSRNTTNVCVTDSRNNCTLLRNACDLEQARCQGQALTIVPNLHCRNFTSTTSRNCFCPNLFNCSTNASTTCVKLNSGCKLLRNQCEVENEKCQGPVIIMSPLHCRRFTFGLTRQCTCPNLKTCSRHNTNICVKTATGCKLMRNECELEELRCQGQNLSVLPAVQCKRLRSGREGPCACSTWLNCQRNSSRVCIETRTGCRLLQNQCDLEERRCRGEVLNVTTPLQCQGFAPGQLRNCACPGLKTCSRNNSTRVCVRNQRNCKLMANSCDLEMAKCRGEKWCTADIEECKNFTLGQQARCACPQLQSCSRNTTNICVNLKGACKLMTNQCALEKAKCKGQAWRPTASIQCQNYIPNQWRWCACPRLLNCCNRVRPFCVKGPRGCKLMNTDCELQLARCRGEIWSRTDDLQCRGFNLGQSVQKCACPNLETCQQKSTSIASSQVCVRNINGCKLLRNDCELERSLCSGEVWQPVDNLQCLNFPIHQTRSCRCPALDNCSNITQVCGRTPQHQCYNFRTECDMRWAQCEGTKLSLTLPQRCQGIKIDDNETCKCPESHNCNRNRQVCGRRGRQCKLFLSDCDFRNSSCRDENWQSTSLSNCCQFRVNDTKACTTDLTLAVCGRGSNNRCHNFPTRCDLNKANKINNEWSLVNQSNCKCIRSGRTGTCAERIVCTPPTNRTPRICGRQRLTHRMFTSQCHLRLHNYERCTNFRAVRTRQCRRRGG